MSALVPRELGGVGSGMIELARHVRDPRAALRVVGDGLRDAPDPGRVHLRHALPPAVLRAVRARSGRAAAPHRLGDVRGRHRRRDAQQQVRDRRAAGERVDSSSTKDARPSPTAPTPTTSSSSAAQRRRAAERSDPRARPQGTDFTARAEEAFGTRSACAARAAHRSCSSRPARRPDLPSAVRRRRQPDAGPLLPRALGATCGSASRRAPSPRARAFVRQQARAKPGTVPPTALRLAEVSSLLQTMRTNVARRRERVRGADEGRRRHRRALVDRLRAQDEQPQGRRPRSSSCRSCTRRS